MNIKYMRGLLLSGLLAAPVVSLAGTVGDVNPDAAATSVIVNFKDLDLGTPAGAETLYQRIAGAAKQVCPPMNSADLHDFTRVQTCRQQVIARTVTSVHSPELAVTYAEHNRRTLARRASMV